MTKRRILGLVFLTLAAVSFAFDLMSSVVKGDTLAFREFGRVWAGFHRDSLLLLQPAVERYLAEWLWDPLILSLLTTPLTFLLLVISLFFLAISVGPWSRS
jgi:hypothetical protein